MPARTLPPAVDAIPPIFEKVARIFDQAQTSTANHQKNFVALHKLHSEAACTKKLAGECDFEDIFLGMVARVIPAKKGVATADRVIKFIGGYVKYLNEKAADEREDDSDSDATDTTASRFTAKLLKFLLRGFQAKDKFVRYRVVCITGEMISVLGELDVVIYDNLQKALLDRIYDKEVMVRSQVVIALSKLAASDAEEGEPSEVMQVLVDTLSHDLSPEVRRVTLARIPVNSSSLPALLARARDTETTIRKLLYSSVLTQAASQTLTTAQRQLLVLHGLGDREETVRTAATDLLVTWIDAIAEGEETEEDLVSRFTDIDISETQEKPLTTSEKKQQKLIQTLPNAFADAYFDFAHLTPERGFLVRVFVDLCQKDKDRGELKMESGGIPVVTSCAFRIEQGYNSLIAVNEKDEEKVHEKRAKEFILAELLKLAVNLDYSDEIGRRKMFSLVRTMLTSHELPLDLVPRCLDVLRKFSPNERDLIRVVVEIIGDLRDPGDEDDGGAADQTQDTINPEDAVDTSFDIEQGPSPKSLGKARETMSPEEQGHADLTDMRCLILCIGMLERVNGTLDENSTLQGLLRDLIMPSVKRKEQQFKEKGSIALGLICLISKDTHDQTLRDFLTEARKDDVPEPGYSLNPAGRHAPALLAFLVTELEKETSPKVLALLGMGIAKLLLCGMIVNEDVVKRLLVVYFSPHNAGNQELKQYLTSFAHVYSRSSSKNQQTMREIFIDVFLELSKLRQRPDAEKDVLSLTSVTHMWMDWTDHTQVQDPNGHPGDAGKAGDPLIQFDMANDIIRSLLTKKMPKEDKRILCQMLLKLHIPEEVDADKIRTLKLLIDNVSTRRPLHDATAHNALKKFDAAIQKKFGKELEGFSEAEYRELQKLQDLFDFLDDIIPEDDDEIIDIDSKKKGKKRRSRSVASMATDDDGASVASSRRKPEKKRRRLSASDDEESDSGDDRTARGAPPPPTRTLPKRAAAKKEVIMISSDDEEDDVDTAPTLRKGRPRVSVRTRKTQEEAMIDADIDDLLDEGFTEIHPDSIINDSDEEDEVNDLLVND
ncbi:Chromosome condensation complex protein [Mycena sanguinolenta]|uniref:Chromosome condensation complex protein n=1 Tax=Mycena sanguinolenta TaxID=230812 RepID=A0A8H6Y9T5_9AGAR|nr:Chromosome condensation complex protein [Mycena sanguinolenta]